MTADEIYEYLTTSLCPDETFPESAVTALCSLAAFTLNNLVKSDADTSDERLLYAASCLVLYRLSLRDYCFDDALEFSAGDVSIRRDLSRSSSVYREMLLDALANAAPLLRDTSFLFRRMRGR